MKLCSLVGIVALALAPGAVAASTPMAPVWIDTDAACDGSSTSDPDDCLALLHLLSTPGLQVEAISTSYGNAERSLADQVVAELIEPLAGAASGPRTLPGAAAPGDCDTAAARSLRARIREPRPIQVLALGPLTNLACALAGSELPPRALVRVVAVMGARPGHVFHPAEERSAKAFLGHGPVFSDLNFAKDPRAARTLLDSRVPITLVPYESARWRELGAEELDALAARGPVAAILAARARPWLRFWARMAGRDGFFPFDLVAAALVTRTDDFACTPQRVRIAHDRSIGLIGGPLRLLLLGATHLDTDRVVELCAPARPRRRIDIQRLFSDIAAAAGAERPSDFGTGELDSNAIRRRCAKRPV